VVLRDNGDSRRPLHRVPDPQHATLDQQPVVLYLSETVVFHDSPPPRSATAAGVLLEGKCSERPARLWRRGRKPFFFVG
jgi:hypothetical protein